jgi:hypothetical protein
MNTSGQQSDTRWLLDQSRQRSDGKIGHETESLQDKTDSALKSLLRNASEIRRLRALHCGRARAVEMPTPTGVISENQKPSPKVANSDLYALWPRAIRGLVNALISIFRPRISNYSAALNAAQR